MAEIESIETDRSAYEDAPMTEAVSFWIETKTGPVQVLATVSSEDDATRTEIVERAQNALQAEFE